MIPTFVAAINTVELIGSYIVAHSASGTTVDHTKKRNRNTTKSIIPAICRKLIKQGYDPRESVRVVRNGIDQPGMIPVFKRDRTLATWAGIDLVENSVRTPHLVKHRPSPFASSAEEPTGTIA